MMSIPAREPWKVDGENALNLRTVSQRVWACYTSIMANRIGTLELMKKSKSGLTYALVAVIVTMSGVPNQLFCQEQQSREETLVDGLKESGNTLLNSTLNDNAEGIVALWSESGVAIGIDGPIVSKLEIRREFQTKSRNFCLFFSTDCLRKQAGFERKDCYKDLLLKAGNKQITYRVNRGKIRDWRNESEPKRGTGLDVKSCEST